MISTLLCLFASDHTSFVYDPRGVLQLRQIIRYLSNGEGDDFIRALQALQEMSSEFRLSPATIRVIERMLRQGSSISHKGQSSKRGGVFLKQMKHLEECLNSRLGSHKAVYQRKKHVRFKTGSRNFSDFLE